MRYGKDLPAGGTIGFVAPAFGCSIEPYRSGFDHAQKKWREMGYNLHLGPNCYLGEGIGISNTPKKCAEEFMAAFLDAESDCLISCGGGELMCEILEYIDFEKIKQASPKWFMGYSDNTNITYLLATICDTASIYGPCSGTFGMEPWHKSIEDAFELLTGEVNSLDGYGKWELCSLKDEDHPLVPYNLTEDLVIKSYLGPKGIDWTKRQDPIRFEGRLLGGCMDCLANLIGTPYDQTQSFLERYREDGIIWFLEPCDLNVFDIRRAMWHMEQAGWFRYVKGFLIGRPRTAYGQEMMGLDAYEAVLNVAGQKDVPVIMDVDLGHLPPMMPLITGSIGEVTVKKNDIHIEMRKI